MIFFLVRVLIAMMYDTGIESRRLFCGRFKQGPAFSCK
jgi:hypothetical protein